MQKLMSHLPGVGQYITMHATLTAREFSHANFYPSGPFTCIFSKTSPSFSPSMLAVANTGSCVGPQNKIGHPAGCRFPCWKETMGFTSTETIKASSRVECPRNINRLKKHDLW